MIDRGLRSFGFQVAEDCRQLADLFVVEIELVRENRSGRLTLKGPRQNRRVGRRRVARLPIR